MNILLCGIGGHMGAHVLSAALESKNEFTVTAGVDINGYDGDIKCFTSFDDVEGEYDCIVDFSHHASTIPLLEYAKRTNTPTIIATTGQTDEEKAAINEAAGSIPVFFSANMSFGIALLCSLARQTAKAMPGAQIEIIEKHHIRKVDAPSGSAKMIFNEIKKVRPDAEPNYGRSGLGKRTENEIGIHAVRMGNIVGEHEVIVGTDTQTITLKHQAHDRGIFAQGALLAAGFLSGKAPGLYNMFDMINED